MAHRRARSRRHLMVVHAFYPLGETRVQREALALVDAGYEVDVVCMNGGNEPRFGIEDGVRVYRLPVRRRRGQGIGRQLLEYLAFFILASFQVTALQLRRRYATVQAHNPPDFLVFSAVIPKLMGARIIVDLHDLTPEFFAARSGLAPSHWATRGVAWQERLACRFADHVITVTEPWRRDLIGRGVPADRLSVVMNLADPRFFSRRPEPVERDAADNGIRLVYHGTFTYRYGLDIIIQAVAKVRSRVPGVRLALIGGGDARDELIEMTKDLGLETHIEFSPRSLQISELAPVLSSADVGIIANRDDVFTDSLLPAKMLEYVALGLPVIAARTSTIAEYFEDDMVQFFTPGDVDELAAAIVALHEDPRRLATIATHEERFNRDYRWQDAAAEYVATIERLRDRHPPLAEQESVGESAERSGTQIQRHFPPGEIPPTLQRTRALASTAREVKIWGGFLGGLRDFLGTTITLEDAERTVRERLERREASFLGWVKRGIYGYPRSPYLRMLEAADCTFVDIRDMVATRGLDATLRALRDSGVYVSFEEYKGRQPIVRNGKVLPVSIADFDNPHAKRYYHGETGGTTGKATRILVDLDHLAAQAPVLMLGREANGLLDVPTAVWLDILPDVAGIMNVLRPMRFGRTPEKWFSPNMIQHSSNLTSAKFRFATLSMVATARLIGHPMPRPEAIGLDEPELIARWMDETLQTRGTCLLYSHVSKALRVAVAAREMGIDLTGATFMAGGEPPTPAKVREITKSGARWVPIYPFSEFGTVGVGCANPADESDVHLLDDGLALIQYPHSIPGTEVSVDAFNFTTLLPTAPKLLLNVESDDYGTIEERNCGCPLQTNGFTKHLRGIRSFSKLTGEGGTLIGSEMIRILEDVLPARFGGSSLDYQLMEEEDERGFTRLSLLVHPRLQIDDERTVVQTVLGALEQGRAGPGEGSLAAEMTRNIWQQADTLRVKRMVPKVTGHGKMMPLHIAHDRPNS